MNTKCSKKAHNFSIFAYLFDISIFIYLIGLSSFAAATPITIVVQQLNPSPNYPLTSDPNDAAQLTDGKTVRHPMWISRGTVGWQNITPVQIIIKTPKTVSSGRLRLHTACGYASGVNLPRWIDVYTQAAGKWTHIANTAPVTDANCQKDYWIEMNLSNIQNQLEIVAHANGDYLFFDEIELLPSETAISEKAPTPPKMVIQGGENTVAQSANFTVAKTTESVITEPNIINDSVKRLKNSVQQISLDTTFAQTTSKRTAGTTTEPLIFWVQDPWASSSNWNLATSNSSLITAQGTDTEIYTVCIGLLPAQSSVVRSVRISEISSVVNAVSYRQLNALLAANGMRVYDRLSPVIDHTLQLDTNEPVYLWIDINLAKFDKGQNALTIQLSDSGSNQMLTSLTIALDIVHATTNVKSLHVIDWSYRDGKLWNDENATFTELLSGGTDTFVIHPTEIPGTQLDGSWNKTAEQKLDNRIQLFRGHGQILLFLNWKNTSNPLLGNKFFNNKDAYLRWLDQITQHLQNLGIPTSQWMLYPIDEPDDNDWASLEQIVNLTSQYNPTIRFYANIIPMNPLSQIPTLTRLAPRLSVWQPKLSYLQSSSGYLFSHLTLNSMWIYEVPPAPAKAASPITYYRSLAWQAYKYGASGVGFWSFSDVGNSSARDDFDGIRPDWAVVYEGDNDQGIQSSRRWEAFKQGMQDYRLLILSGINKNLIDEPSKYSSEDLQIIRKQALDLLRRQQQ